jgi:hypothetical protein
MGGLNLIEIGVTVVWWRLTLRTKTKVQLLLGTSTCGVVSSKYIVECTGEELSKLI